MAQWVENLARSFRWADAFDIALVAVFLYALLSWFKQTASRSVLIGVILLAMVYFLARAFDMYVTALIFRAAFTVLLVALVVVFQEDLRRGFERLGTWGKWGENRRFPPDLAYLETIAETAAALAERRVGALIVLRGSESLERHLNGGVPLDGAISRSLLESIFDPHSTGHDGAVIVENGRISQFAVHLPLSHAPQPPPAHRGTRHAAAVGLSECCDALVIVVSEERGRISVAERGKLRQLASIVDLEERLEKFSQRNFPRARRATRWRLLRVNFPLKAAALAAACLAWFFISYRAATVQQSFRLPVEFRNVPKNLVVTDSNPVAVTVTLTGPERAFFLLEPSALKVSFDLSKIGEGAQYLEIKDSNVSRPSGLEVYRIEPRVVSLIVHQLRPVTLRVEVPTTGQLPEPLRLKGIRVEPATVKAQSWLTAAAAPSKIQTEPVDLSHITKTTTFDAQLVVPEYVRFPGQIPPKVRVTVEVAQAAAP
jgi:uncharacterized protein (TIGR00159 family)